MAHGALRRANPRLFLSQADLPLPDLIIFPERGQFGGPTGGQTLSEDSLFTVEALRAAWARLAPEGRLAQRDPRHIPWAGGIEGAGAVLAAPVAARLAYRAGCSGLAIASGLAYLLAAFGALGAPGKKTTAAGEG